MKLTAQQFDALHDSYQRQIAELTAKRDTLRAEVEAQTSRAAMWKARCNHGTDASELQPGEEAYERLRAERDALRAELAEMKRIDNARIAELDGHLRNSSRLMDERDQLKDRLSIVAKTDNVRGLVERLQAEVERLRAELRRLGDEFQSGLLDKLETIDLLRVDNERLKAELEADVIVHTMHHPDGRVETYLASDQAAQLRSLREAAEDVSERMKGDTYDLRYVINRLDAELAKVTR